MGEYASRGVGTAGLTTGIIGTSLAGIMALNNGGLLGGLFGGNQAAQMANAAGLGVLAEKDSEIARLKAEKYADLNGIEVYKQLKTEMTEQRDALLGNWIKPLADEAAANKVTIATIQAEQKAEAEKNLLREQLVKAEIEKQSLLAAQGIQCVQSQINCMNGRIGGLQQTVEHITKIVIPKDVVCPEYMEAKNAWIAPTTVTTTTTNTAG